MRHSPGSSTFPSDQRKWSSSGRRDWSTLKQAVTCGMWGNDTARTLTRIPHTQHEHPSHQTAVRESLICLPFPWQTWKALCFVPKQKSKLWKIPTIFAGQKYLLFAKYHFLLRSQSAGNTLSLHLGEKVFLGHLFCSWTFSVCQHEVWE